MKRLLASLFALSFTAAAQTMVGLPQGGIAMFGNPVQLTNQGTKAIFCMIVRSEKDGKPMGTGGTSFASNPILAHSLPHPLQFAFKPTPADRPDTIYVDGVVFEDGTFVGPDKSNSFPTLTRQIAGYVATGALLQRANDKAAVWSQIENLRNATLKPSGSREPDGEALGKKGAAIALINARLRYGDDAARVQAAKFVALGSLQKEN